MIAIGSLLVLVLVSLIVTRAATLILVATGVSRTAARFQARSAFTGAGFTTSESEMITENPLRRKVIMNLMMIGHIGIVASAGTLILGFDHGTAGHLGLTAIELIVGMFALIMASRSQWVDRHATRLIVRVLQRFHIDGTDVARLIELPEHVGVCELHVHSGDWLAGRPLSETALRDEGVEVLGLTTADHRFHPRVGPGTVVEPGDVLVVYGNLRLIDELDSRPAGEVGDQQHRERCAKPGAAADQPVSPVRDDFGAPSTP